MTATGGRSATGRPPVLATLMWQFSNRYAC
jgi:hypothetical protein